MSEIEEEVKVKVSWGVSRCDVFERHSFHGIDVDGLRETEYPVAFYRFHCT